MFPTKPSPDQFGTLTFLFHLWFDSSMCTHISMKNNTCEWPLNSASLNEISCVCMFRACFCVQFTSLYAEVLGGVDMKRRGAPRHKDRLETPTITMWINGWGGVVCVCVGGVYPSLRCCVSAAWATCGQTKSEQPLRRWRWAATTSASVLPGSGRRGRGTLYQMQPIRSN